MARALAVLYPLALAFSVVDAALPWLTVRPVDLEAAPLSARRFVIADEFGRELTLRGACVEAEERSFPPYQRSTLAADYANGSCPDNVNGYQEPPICGVDAGKGKWAADISACGRNDFAQARALGFNIVRLCLSWSSLEYSPGVYNTSYLDRVAQLVAWAEEQDVVRDAHVGRGRGTRHIAARFGEDALRVGVAAMSIAAARVTYHFSCHSRSRAHCPPTPPFPALSM